MSDFIKNKIDFSFFSHIAASKKLPDSALFLSELSQTNEILQNENPVYRPLKHRKPGYLIDFIFQKKMPLIVVPDLHARFLFLYDLLMWKIPLDVPDCGGMSVYDALSKYLLRVVCVGDGIHSESAGYDRWIAAFKDYQDGIYTGSYMQEEMSDSLITMRMVLLLKRMFPEQFHFLKGNHENIENAEGNGNHPFRKYVQEGEMVYMFMKMYYGDKIIQEYSSFEHLLPVCTLFPCCIVSHAEPVRSFSRQELISGDADVVEGLTWTANGEARNGSVLEMIEKLYGRKKIEEIFYITGHRHVRDLYSVRQNGLLVQIHNPVEEHIAFIRPERKFDPEKDIVSVRGNFPV